jgi:formimidoylglutamase
MSKRINCCIIGIPDHQGVINVGGRVGAGRGPIPFRNIFRRFKSQHPVLTCVTDKGDVTALTSDAATNHKQAIDFIKKNLTPQDLSVIIGGGHDHGYSHLAGVAGALLKSSEKKIRLGCINIDAHLDVRKPAPMISSGSPFYLALESGVLDPKRFIEFGIQSHCNSAELWEYVEQKGVKVIPYNQLRNGKAVSTFKKALKKLSTSCDAIVISLDLDALAAAYCPGVSAPQAEGFTPSEIIEMMEIAGANKKCVSLGIFELNPEHDEDLRTARLAATAAFHFIESSLF